MTTREILIAAREQIADPDNWTQGSAARGPRFTAPYCSMGAVYKVVGAYDIVRREGVGSQSARMKACEGAYKQALEPLADVMGGNVAGYNDHHTHDCVIAAFDVAIEKITPPATERLPCGAEVALV